MGNIAIKVTDEEQLAQLPGITEAMRNEAQKKRFPVYCTMYGQDNTMQVHGVYQEDQAEFLRAAGYEIMSV